VQIVADADDGEETDEFFTTPMFGQLHCWCRPPAHQSLWWIFLATRTAGISSLQCGRDARRVQRPAQMVTTSRGSNAACRVSRMKIL
jgi:hypothetical protein